MSGNEAQMKKGKLMRQPISVEIRKVAKDSHAKVIPDDKPGDYILVVEYDDGVRLSVDMHNRLHGYVDISGEGERVSYVRGLPMSIRDGRKRSREFVVSFVPVDVNVVSPDTIRVTDKDGDTVTLYMTAHVRFGEVESQVVDDTFQVVDEAEAFAAEPTVNMVAVDLIRVVFTDDSAIDLMALTAKHWRNTSTGFMVKHIDGISYLFPWANIKQTSIEPGLVSEWLIEGSKLDPVEITTTKQLATFA